MQVSSSDLSAACDFIVAQAIRVPKVRDQLGTVGTLLLKMLTELMTESAETFARAQAEVPRLKNLSLEDATRLLTAPISIELDATSHLVGLLGGLGAPLIFQLSRLLANLSWALLSAPDESIYITSDAPVSILSENLPPLAFAALASPGSSVCMPLSPRLTLVGCRVPGMTDSPVPRVAIIAAAPRWPALVNGLTVVNSQRFLYGLRSDFEWTVKLDEAARHWSDVPQAHAYR